MLEEALALEAVPQRLELVGAVAVEQAARAEEAVRLPELARAVRLRQQERVLRQLQPGPPSERVAQAQVVVRQGQLAPLRSRRRRGTFPGGR